MMLGRLTHAVYAKLGETLVPEPFANGTKKRCLNKREKMVRR